jgi:hypothetical protein
MVFGFALSKAQKTAHKFKNSTRNMFWKKTMISKDFNKKSFSVFNNDIFFYV